MHLPGDAENAVLSAWRATLARRAGTPALFSERGAVLRSFDDIEAEAGQWTRALSELPSLEPGSVIAIQSGNRPEFPALLLASWRLGLVPLPLGRHLDSGSTAAALETCRASALVEIIGDRLVPTFLPYKSPVWPQPQPDFLKLTSGTTSAPRAIRFRAEQLLADCFQICETMGIGEADLNYGVIPLSHSYGFSNLLTPLICRGVPLALSEDPMPRAILDGLAHTGATVFPGMPVFFDKLAVLAEFQQPPALPHLRLCISAGAPLTPPVAERFAAKFGLKIHTFYGSSECGGIAYDRSPTGGKGEVFSGHEEGFVGSAMAGVRITAQSDETIAVESAAVGDGYWPVDQEQDTTLSNGRFIPGDLVRFEPHGMFLTGRISDFINVAGRKLNPVEVEAHLLRFPGVRQAVVFGVASKLRHEEAVACVAGDFDPNDLLAFARITLSGWQTPKDIWMVPEIPANERGKISRRELAKRYAELKS